jgi:hypothetical protein
MHDSSKLTKGSRTLAVASTLALALAAGCSAAPGGERAEQRSEALTTSGPHENYYGGPVVQNVKVVLVLWGPSVNAASQLPGFYTAVTNSAYMDWLSEYGTPGHPIGRGVYAGAYTVPAPTTTLDDSALTQQLNALITAGTLPKPDANTVYANHFPPGVTLTTAGAASCKDFCTYHGTFAANVGGDGFYTVIPDMFTGACASGCGNGTALQNTTMQASAQLLNAITDPFVGLATQDAAPLAWYDPTFGEVSYPCNDQAGTIASSWTVQLGWSNYSGKCIDAPSPPAPPPPPPPSCTTSTACGSVVKVTCAAYPQNMLVLRQDANVPIREIGSLGAAGGTYTDTASASTEGYLVCNADGSICGPALYVTVNTQPCSLPAPSPRPPPPKCLGTCQ